MFIKPLAAAPALLFSIVLVACGGGGGGGGSAAPAPANLSSAPGDASISSYFTTSQSVTLSASDTSGNTYTVQLSQTPVAGTTSFNGSTVISATRSLALTRNGTSIATSTETVYFTASPFVSYGNVSSTGTPYTVVTAQTAIPTTISVGQSGALTTATLYHDASKAVVDAQSVTTYTVSAATPSAVQLCTNGGVSGVTAQGTADGLANDTETDCYHVTANGTATLFSISLTISGITLNFK